MVLITWLNTLQYLRLYENFRMLIDLCLKVFLDVQTWRFMVVFSIMLMAFCSSHYQYFVKKGDAVTFGNFFQMIIYTGFGDFGESETYEEGEYEQMFFFAFSIFCLCLIMLNLLIGILSEVMANILSTAEQSDYAALCDICSDLENLMFWVPQDKVDKSDQQHLIFVEEPQLEEKEDGEKTRERVEELEQSLKQDMELIKVSMND
jgi:hypothetical protein